MVTPVIPDSPRVGAARLVEITPAVSAAVVRTHQSPESLRSLTAAPAKSAASAADDDDVAGEYWTAVVTGRQVGGFAEVYGRAGY